MKIKTISVKGLFGIYDHKIEMSDDSVSIVLGDNGLGKTTIFRMVNAFFNKNYQELLNENYEEMKISFYNEATLTFSPKYTNLERDVLLTYRKSGKKKLEVSLNDLIITNEKLYKEVRKRIKLYSNSIEESLLSEDLQKQESLKDLMVNEIIAKFSLKDKKIFKDLSKFQDLQSSCNVIYVKAQRILTPIEVKYKRIAEGNAVYRETLEIYSQELKERINATKSAANDNTTLIDGSYLIRLVESIKSNEKTNTITLKELNKKFETINSKQKELSELNLIKYDLTKAINLNKWYNNDKSLVNSIIDIYLNDMNEKLSLFDTLFRKLRLFVDLANGYMTDKRLEITSTGEISISFRNTHHKSGINNAIPLNRLSSGEQNLLVLLYNLIFIAREDSTVLLDEPEISLHVVWQRRFVDDLLEIIKVNPLQICMATHSPSVISTHWDLTQELTNDVEYGEA